MCTQNQKNQRVTVPGQLSFVSGRTPRGETYFTIFHHISTATILGGHRGGISAHLSDNINFSMELYYGDQLCSKCMTKSFVTHLVNVIQAYTYNTIIILQSLIACIVIDIAGILVCIVLRMPMGLPPAP